MTEKFSPTEQAQRFISFELLPQARVNSIEALQLKIGEVAALLQQTGVDGRLVCQLLEDKAFQEVAGTYLYSDLLRQIFMVLQEITLAAVQSLEAEQPKISNDV